MCQVTLSLHLSPGTTIVWPSNEQWAPGGQGSISLILMYQFLVLRKCLISILKKIRTLKLYRVMLLALFGREGKWLALRHHNNGLPMYFFTVLRQEVNINSLDLDCLR